MFGRLLRLTGTVLVIAVAFVTPVLVTSTPASADTVVNGCTIVSSPTPTNFTNCPGANLSGLNLSGLNLNYANLSGANLSGANLSGISGFPPNITVSTGTSFAGANLTDANLAGATLEDCMVVNGTPTIQAVDCFAASFAGATMTGAQLNTDLGGVDLSSADLTGADLSSASEPGCFTFVLGPFGNQTECPSPDFANANLAGATFATCSVGVTTCTVADLSGATLTDANLSNAVFAAESEYTNPALGPCPPANVFQFCTVGTAAAADLIGINFSGANLSDAVLTATSPFPLTSGTTATVSLSGTTLTGANLTGTILVPSNQTVTATSQAGAVVSWSTPAAIPGATPGTCTPASGSTFHLFTSSVTCQVTDGSGDVATGTFQVDVQPTTSYFTFIGLPSDGAVVAGTTYLDAGAGDGPGVTKVVFELSGGTLSNQVIGTATGTLYGWILKWDTTTIPNGTYSLAAVATDAAGNTDTSSPITITVNNAAPTTYIGIPANGATQSGSEWLDAGASAGVTSVNYELSGGNLSDQVISGSVPTAYGWIGAWNTTSVANGTYTLQSVACYAGGVCGTSAPVTITVSN